MKSNRKYILEMFEPQLVYEVPVFQRRYVWKKEHWEMFWEDISTKAAELNGEKRNEVGAHFVGAVVLKEIERNGVFNTKTVEVIDGQQRLTTVQIMLAAFSDLTRGENEVFFDRMQTWIKNATASESRNQFKVRPTNTDRLGFQLVMSSRSKSEIEEEGKILKSSIVDAYLFFHGKLKEFCFDSESRFLPDKCVMLLGVCQNYMQLITIELDSHDDPQLIFETLNARGVELLPSDLIRNFIFRLADKEGLNATKIYDEHWKRYEDAEEEKGFWHEDETQGRITRKRIDWFAHHYVLCKTRSAFDIKNLFQTFRKWWENEQNRDVEQELRELGRYGDAYTRLVTPAQLGGDVVDRLARRIRILGTKVIYTLLLTILRDENDRVVRDELDAILTEIESYVVRRVVCKISSQGFNKFIISLVQGLQKIDQISLDSVRELLLKSQANPGRWPDDGEFLNAWLGTPAYRSAKDAHLCKMVLLAIEDELITSRQEGVFVDPEGLTIEHMMPQGWNKKDWSLPAGTNEDETALRREQLIHTFGNLTLLKRELNSAASNGPFAGKRDLILEESVLRLNQYFSNIGVWNEEAIEKRGRELFEIAKKVWPHPGR